MFIINKSLTKSTLLHGKSDSVQLSIWIHRKKHVTKHLKNSSVETLPCTSGEAVQADSRIHKGEGKKSLKSELQFLWGSAEIKISWKKKHFHLTENCQYFLFRHYLFFFFIYILEIQNKTSTPCRTKCLVFSRTLHCEIGPSTNWTIHLTSAQEHHLPAHLWRESPYLGNQGKSPCPAGCWWCALGRAGDPYEYRCSCWRCHFDASLDRVSAIHPGSLCSLPVGC